MTAKYYVGLAKATLPLRQVDGVWAHFGVGPRLDCGWKLHISTTPSQAAVLLERVLPILVDARVPFKIARNPDTLIALNVGRLGATQVGKFITIYPQCSDDAVALADKLNSATKGMNGPAIPSDIRLGDVVYARFGAFSPTARRDRLGRIHSRLKLPDGTSATDDRTVPFSHPPSVSNPFLGSIAECKNGEETFFEPGYSFLKVLNRNSKGCVYLGLRLTSQEDLGYVVLKEARPWCSVDLAGCDGRDRLQDEYNLLRALASRVRVPTAYETFNIEEKMYLSLEYVEGRALTAEGGRPFGQLGPLRQRRMLTSAIGFLRELEAMHQDGWVHRDVKPTNVRVRPCGEVVLIDLEMAARSGAEGYGNGTPGLAAPELEAGAEARAEQDVFSAGATLIQLFCAVSAHKLLVPSATRRAEVIECVSGVSRQLAQALTASTSLDPESRPTIDELVSEVRREADRTHGYECGPSVRAPLCSEREGVHSQPSPRGLGGRRVTTRLADVLAGVARGLLFEAPTNEYGIWLSRRQEMHAGVAVGSPWEFSLYRSANRGVAGIVYLLARLVYSGLVRDRDLGLLRSRVNTAIDWLLSHHPTDDDQLPGLHFGEAGVAVAVCWSVRAGLIERGAWLDEYLKEALSGTLDWPDYTHGAAGQGTAAILCADLVERPRLLEFADDAARYLIQNQADDGSWLWPEGVSGMEGTAYTGFAHGTAGCVHFLAELSMRRDNPLALKSAELGAAWLEQQGRQGSTGTRWPTVANGNDFWGRWCHGGAGISLAFMRLYQATSEERYRDRADAALSALSTTPSDNLSNLTQCCGMAGLGEAYLEGSEFVRQAWRRRAEAVAGILSCIAHRDRLATVWPTEGPRASTPDLMSGWGGIPHFLINYYDSGEGRNTGPPLGAWGRGATPTRKRFVDRMPD